MAVSLNGDGTITGLSTLSSVTITGLTSLTTTDLTADTTTLVVDSANNRVGIGTASPSTTLQVVGTATATAFSGPLTGNVTGDVSGNAGTVTNGVYTTDIGSTVQAYDADLTTLAGLSSADGNFIVGSATGWVVESGATARTSLGLGTAATSATGDFATAAQGSLADSALQSADIGSTVQAYDADLTTLAGLSSADGNFIVGSATGWVAESGATARTSLGLGALATLSSVDGSTIDDNSVSAAELNVSGNGTAGQYLASDGDGSMTWTTLAAGGGFSNMQVFTSPGTWTNPGSVTKVKVTVLGGGGGGNGFRNASYPPVSGGGGAGGGTSIGVFTIPTSPVPVTIGPGGSAGASPGGFYQAGTGGTGGTSSFGAYASATGGGGAPNAVGSFIPFGATSTYSVAASTGGTGSGGSLNVPGQSGGQASGGYPSLRCIHTHGGGNHLFAGGTTLSPGGPGDYSGTSGAANSGTGGTGGITGSSTTVNGGAGGSGLVIVEW